MNIEAIQRICMTVVDPIRRKISLIVGRCVLSAVVDDTTKFQSIQADVFSGETLSELERVQNYGFTSVPFKGSEAVIVFPQGNRDHGVVICVDDRRYRLKGLAEGEVAIYTDEGDKIHFKRGNQIDIFAAEKIAINTKVKTIESTTSFTVTAPEATVIASTKAKIESPAIELGATATDFVLKGTTFQAGYNSHTHLGNLGYPTTPPQTPSPPTDLSLVSKTQ